MYSLCPGGWVWCGQQGGHVGQCLSKWVFVPFPSPLSIFIIMCCNEHYINLQTNPWLNTYNITHTRNQSGTKPVIVWYCMIGLDTVWSQEHSLVEGLLGMAVHIQCWMYQYGFVILPNNLHAVLLNVSFSRTFGFGRFESGVHWWMTTNGHFVCRFG